jgi:small GTP-binding protein
MGVDYSTQYYCTNGYEIHHLVLHTDRGIVKFEVWDTSGQEKTGALRQHYYENSHGAILMFGYNSRITFKSMKDWRDDITQCNGNIPFALVATFHDIEPHKVKERDIEGFQRRYRPTMLNEPFQMSPPTDTFADVARPVLRLAERLMGMESETLHLV